MWSYFTFLKNVNDSVYISTISFCKKYIYKNIVVFCLQSVTIEGFNCKMLKLLRCVNEYRII